MCEITDSISPNKLFCHLDAMRREGGIALPLLAIIQCVRGFFGAPEEEQESLFSVMAVG